MTTLNKLLSKLIKFFLLDRRPPPDIAAINIQRIFMMMCILAPLHVAQVGFFLTALLREKASVNDMAYQWRMGIILAHSVMLVVSVAAGVMAHRIREKKLENSYKGRVLAMSTALSYLIFGAAVCVIDQLVTATINPYLVSSVTVALVVIIPPHLSAILYSVTYLFFYLSLPLGQSSNDLLLSLQVNGISAAGIGFGVSLIIWRTNAINFFQKKFIEKQTLEMEEKNRQLERMAGTDVLTGLHNRMRFIEFLNREIKRIKRTREKSCLIILDLDHFKEVNDKHGHPGGDTALRLTADAIHAQLRESDILARFGGEEFTILLPGTSIKGGFNVAEKIRTAIERLSFPEPMKDLRITASFGLAVIHAEETDSFDTAYQEADKALYLAKNGGRNRIECLYQVGQENFFVSKPQ